MPTGKVRPGPMDMDIIPLGLGVPVPVLFVVIELALALVLGLTVLNPESILEAPDIRVGPTLALCDIHKSHSIRAVGCM